MKNKEIRCYNQDKLNIEARSDGGNTIVGYASVFNKESENMGFFKETIKPGAFTRTLKENPDIRALLDHQTGKIIARTKAGNLKLKEDDRGLKVEIDPIDTTDGRDAIEWVKSGVVDGMSFGFRVIEDSWHIKDGINYREIIDVDLYEVSLVAFPAYPDTSVFLRSANEAWKEYSEKQAKPSKRLLDSAKRRIKLLSY